MKIIIIDVDARSISSNGKHVFLTPKEYLLFECVTESRIKKAVVVDDIIRHVWKGREVTVGRLNISQLIFRLRRKLEYIDDCADISFSMTNGVSSSYLSKCLVLKNNGLTRAISSIFIRRRYPNKEEANDR
ncbi:winged helix-turn-helix domain-containing protein [Serratia marcescens]|uniref:winged helix-turn-helix domain-containing protein n=1 Tax=Serratia marcescens TaxID=615 RepID=UPI000907C04F|nr:winged helix-turn-helix domain-containing protein [Serratia marcescens]